MLLRVTHLTDYRYSQPVAEAYLELRLSPPERDTQRIDRHQLVLAPAAKVSQYEDYFGNRVAFVSLPYRHSRLTIRSDAVIETRAVSLPERSLDLSVEETRQILTSALPFVFDYLQPTEMVKTGRESTQWARRHLSGRTVLRQGLESLMRSIHENFEYRKGATEFSTDLSVIWRDRIGVCQDFAHIMLTVLRTAGLPARYVCGYIETAPPGAANGDKLVGSLATHAWVEVLIPGHTWAALDPTNNRWCGEQHVGVSFGRDASDAAPIRGTFKGAGTQSMKVHVKMKRLREAAKPKKPPIEPKAGSTDGPRAGEATKA